MDVAIATIIPGRDLGRKRHGESIVRKDIGPPLRRLLFILRALLCDALLRQWRANQHYAKDCEDNRFHRLQNILSARPDQVSAR
jgi:hypothetical protein